MSADEPPSDSARSTPIEPNRTIEPPSISPIPEGCMTVRTHNMQYIGQGYWRCANCGWEPPEPGPPTEHHHHVY